MMTPFQKEITQGLPEHLPAKRSVPGDVNRAPKRKDILTAKEKKLALENALRYFPVEWHKTLAAEFLEENGKNIIKDFNEDFEDDLEIHLLKMKLLIKKEYWLFF